MNKSKIEFSIIVSAIVWGAVIIGCSLALKSTECYGEIQNILVAGVICPFGFNLGSVRCTSSKLMQ